ncbi:hypothetical protein C8Q77DRAFT_1066143 [Trametes polyzona]|nr:hypothetical protein C8Q77DRAFT_1066143 [Trametes polyzona]
MADDEHDPGFAALPERLQKRIDDAFDTALGHADLDASEPTPKRRKLDHSSPQPGGFGGFVRDYAGGGFMADEPSEDSVAEEPRAKYIPLSLIPNALQLLDLQPDDEDVLSVFRNAASGWGSRGRRSSQPETDEAVVSRKDWRAVCAALLDAGGDEDGEFDAMEEEGQEEATEEAPEEVPSDSGEEYMEQGGTEGDSEEGEDSDDDYQGGGGGEGGFVRTKNRRSGRKGGRGGQMGRKRRSSPGSADGGGLSGRQKAECRAAFALFFPDASEEELERRRIGIKDISRVAQLLKEKITAEETVEMLEAFSSTADKTMGLAEFERMMVAAKLA